MIFVESKRKKQATIERLYPGAVIIDVTSKAPSPWVRFSPFFPHGEIPIPFSEGQVGQSVEGIWQGMKVFTSADIDPTAWQNVSMKGLKRTVRKYGSVLGHRRGISSSNLLPYDVARRDIYVPMYHWVLQHKLALELAALKAIAECNPVVLLDYETNTDLDNLQKPLSHAGLIQAWLK